MRIIFTTTLIFMLIAACQHKKTEYKTLGSASTIHQVKIVDIIQSDMYTFLLVNEVDKEYWMAVNKVVKKVNDVIYYKNSLRMNDFRSEQLGRVFEEIYFVEKIGDSPEFSDAKSTNSSHEKSHTEPSSPIIKIDPAPDGIRIGQLYKKKQDYSNRKVSIRGLVVKVNKNIMDRNWVHLQDGTNNEGKNDLTFTTLEMVAVGDTITFEGTVALNKEYGAGYVYPLIVEEAILK